MATTVTNSSRGLVRVALALTLAGLLAVLSGGLLIITGGPASSTAGTEDRCVPSEAWTETTDWVTESPGDGWYVDEQQTVVDEEATHEETGWVTEAPDGEGWVQVDERVVDGALIEDAVDQWWHWNPGDAGGVQDPTGPPPLAGWNTDNGNHNGVPAPPNEAYNTSNEQSGNSSWFFHEVRDAIYEQVTEYRYTKDTPAVTHDEFIYAFDHPAIECPDEPTVPPDPTDTTEPPEVLPSETTGPTGTTEPTEPAGPDGATHTTGPEETPAVEVLGEQATRQRSAVPRAVDAGVGGRTTAEVWGAGLVGGGLVLLLAAGGALVGARRLEGA